MGLNEKLVAAVEPIVSTVRPDMYVPAVGENIDEWCTYDRDEYPRLMASGAPRRMLSLYQLHYFCDNGVNPQDKLDALRLAVFRAGFTFPTLTNASDSDGQHWVLEFEGSEAISYG